MRLLAIVAEEMALRMMQAYDALGLPPGAKRRARRRWLEFWMIGLHQSGDSDNSTTNGLHHAAVRMASLQFIPGMDANMDPQVRIAVEGDDGADAGRAGTVPVVFLHAWA